MQNLDPKEFLTTLTEVAKTFEPEKENYLISYPHFIEYFEKIDEIEEHHLVIGISFIYSWMPTILKFKEKNKEDDNSVIKSRFPDVLKILNNVKNDKSNSGLLDKKELQYLKISCNNSLVGTSKLLHFIDPEKYAIWDSKVFKNLYSLRSHNYKIKKPESYLEYLQFLKELTQENNFNEFYSVMKDKFSYITQFRALEFAIFKLNSKDEPKTE